jgi:hypothetical protein
MAPAGMQEPRCVAVVKRSRRMAVAKSTVRPTDVGRYRVFACNSGDSMAIRTVHECRVRAVGRAGAERGRPASIVRFSSPSSQLIMIALRAGRSI